MSIKHLFPKGLLVTAFVMSLGGVAVAQTAGPGPGATMPPPIKTVPAMPTKPALPMTAPTLPAAKAAVTPNAALAAGVASNPDGSCPETAPVKVSRSKIYHVPEERNYAKTKAKQCFASAEAATQAGYRAPKK